MKKRSMLAFASLAVGMVASLTAPSAHASVGGAVVDPQGLSRLDGARPVVDTAVQQAAQDADALGHGIG